mmetsp:Transcript_4139/g.9284  ORF Transcript_4139/g.9284 Transcript_4139/m.9284 type:complete len:106 (-) Transcript_4139:746-1063(-)
MYATPGHGGTTLSIDTLSACFVSSMLISKSLSSLSCMVNITTKLSKGSISNHLGSDVDTSGRRFDRVCKSKHRSPNFWHNLKTLPVLSRDPAFLPNGSAIRQSSF